MYCNAMHICLLILCVNNCFLDEEQKRNNIERKMQKLKNQTALK
jgi:polysaccharide deacetylase 2 family uncharacterized protein YibQ